MNRGLFQWDSPLSSSATIKTKHLSVISEKKRSMEEKDNIQT